MDEKNSGLEIFSLIHQIRFRFLKLVEQQHIAVHHFMLLKLITDEKDVPMNRIAKILGVTNPAVTHFVDQLEKKGLVKRSPSGKDRRVTLLVMTTKGQKIFDAIEGKIMHIVSEAFNEFDKDTQTQIKKFYELILRKIEEESYHEKNK